MNLKSEVRGTTKFCILRWFSIDRFCMVYFMVYLVVLLFAGASRQDALFALPPLWAPLIFGHSRVCFTFLAAPDKIM